MTVTEVNALKDLTPVDTLSGMVVNVYERKTGTTSKGRAYALQNIILKDSSGTVKILLDGRQECPKSMEGKQVSLSSVRGEKGLTGVLKKTDSYNGKDTVVVQVNNVAVVKVVGSQNGGTKITQVSTCNTNPTMVLGQTVGMAVNNAVQILLAVKQSATVEYFAGDEFIYDLESVASSIIHVSKALELGEPLKRPQEPRTRQETPKQEEGASDTDGNFLSGDSEGPF